MEFWIYEQKGCFNVFDGNEVHCGFFSEANATKIACIRAFDAGMPYTIYYAHPAELI